MSVGNVRNLVIGVGAKIVYWYLYLLQCPTSSVFLGSPCSVSSVPGLTNNRLLAQFPWTPRKIWSP